MATRIPTLHELSAAAAKYGFVLTEEDLASFQVLIAGTLASYDILDTLKEPKPAVTHPRTPGHRPAPEDNPLNAWYVRTSIPGTPGGPLDGRTVAIKDNTCVAGVPMMNGSRTLEGYVPDQDATVVSRLLAAGAEIAGKAVCEDLCFSGGSHTPATGPVHNPWDPSRSAGGSSGGSAALVASGAVDMALGGDQGGSIRIPAAFCGVVGLKPTHGLVPYTGAFPIEATLDHLGPIARTVRDVAAMLQVIAGPDGADPRQDPSTTPDDYVGAIERGVEGMRVGVVREGFGWADLSDPAVDEGVRSAAARLAEAGAEVVEISVPAHLDGLHIWNAISIEGATTQMLDLHGYGMNWKGHYNTGLIQAFHAGLRAHANDLSETVKLVALLGTYLRDAYGGRHYAKARNIAPRLTAAYDEALGQVDVLAMPTLPIVASPIPAPDAPRQEYVARALEMLPNTAPFDVTGHPAISVPAGLAGGLPAGLMLIGRHYAEATLLRFAAAFERLTGGFPMPSRGDR